MSEKDRPVVAVILPPREEFSPSATGAIGLLVRRLARHATRFRPVIVGLSTTQPFTDVEFRPVRLPLLPDTLAGRYASGVARVVRDLRPAVIEMHNRPDIALFLAARFRPKPVVLMLHNDPQGMRGAGDAAARTYLLAHATRVATVSNHLRARLLDGVHPAMRHCTVLPNCLDLAEVPPPAAQRDQVILFAGRVVADKGADSFVRAAAIALSQLPGWRAEMIGADRFGANTPETPFLRQLRGLAADAGVVMHGYQPNDAVLAAMARAAMVVVPSRWPEPFGLTALEAMACGAPLLYAPRGGLPEVAGDAGLDVNPDDPAAMAAAMVALARAPQRLAAMAEAGLARAARFAVAPAAAALDALREDALDAWSRRLAVTI